MAKKDTSSSTSPKSGKKIDLLFIVYIPVILFTFLFSYNKAFDKKISLGGDNAGYYILGQSIAQGEGYTNIHVKHKSSHNHFPVGYPILIATASKLFSGDIQLLKKMNGFFFLTSILLLFAIVVEITKNYHIAFLSSIFVMINFHLLSYSFIIMSEIPFLLFSLLSLLILLKLDFNKKFYQNHLLYILIICVSFTYHIRSTGLALFVGISSLLFIIKKWKYFLTFISGFILLGIPWYLRGAKLGGSSYLKQIVQINPYRPELGNIESFQGLFSRIWENFERYATREIPYGTFNFITTPNYRGEITSMEWLVGLGLLAVIVFGLLSIKSKRSKLILGFYLAGTFGILLLWPPVWTGVRFLVPLIPILFFLFVFGLYAIASLAINLIHSSKAKNYAFASCFVATLLFLPTYANSIEKLSRSAKAGYNKKFSNYFELAQWVNKNGSPNSVTCCRKEKLFYMFSNKHVTNYKSTLDIGKQIKHLTESGVTYVILEQLGYSSTGRYLYPAIQANQSKFKLIKHIEDPDTYLFEFLPNMAYTGEWKGDKKHGKGIFVWENGNKFEGTWKDDLRNGPGKIIFPTGQYITGTWLNDQIDGKAKVFSPQHKLIEIQQYENNKLVNRMPQ